jgi:sugar phosphate isomerase/epimerase
MMLVAGHATPAFATEWGLGRSAPVQPTVDRIGLQLYTLGRALSDDFEGSMEKVATIGYRVVEFAGYGGKTPEQVRATLDRLKITAPSTHIGMAALRSDFDTQVHIAKTVGHQYITIPSLGRETPRGSVAEWKKVADEFNEMAAKLKPHGILLGFHSHRDEYVDVGGGKKGMDIIMENTDPESFAWEMDLGWAYVASQNPMEWFQKYPGRIKMWHVKGISALSIAQARQIEEMRNPPAPRQPPAAGPRPAGAPGAAPGAAPRAPGGPRPERPAAVPVGGPVPVGAGDIDYKPVFAQWKASGLEHFFVEQDGATNWPGGAFSGIATSYRNLVNILS